MGNLSWRKHFKAAHYPTVQFPTKYMGLTTFPLRSKNKRKLKRRFKPPIYGYNAYEWQLLQFFLFYFFNLLMLHEWHHRCFLSFIYLMYSVQCLKFCNWEINIQVYLGFENRRRKGGVNAQKRKFRDTV